MLAEPGRHAGRTHELTGPRSLTFAEAVALISAASGLPMTYRRTTPAAYERSLVDQGAGAAAAANVTAMFAVMERGLIAGTTDGVAAVLGREPRTFEDYAVRAAAAGAWHR